MLHRKTTLKQEKGSTLSKVPFCKSNTNRRIHPIVLPWHAARETDAYRVLRESSRRWIGKFWLRELDFAYSYLESPAPAIEHSVRWPESMIFLSAFLELFKMNISQLTSGADLQKKYDREYASLDVFPSTTSVGLAHHNLQPLSNWHSTWILSLFKIFYL